MFRILAPFYSPRWITSYFIWPFVILMALIWFPITGVFLMMMAGIPYIIAGLFPHLIAIAFVIDVIFKRLPIALLLIPIIPYVLYCVFFMIDQQNMAAAERDIRQSNSMERIVYDPSIHSLILPNSHITHYKIPVSYTINENHPAGYTSFRLLTQDLCRKIQDKNRSIHTVSVSWRSTESRYKKTKFSNICSLNMPEVPPKQKLSVVVQETEDRHAPLQKKTYQFFIEDNKMGEYTEATYAALPKFPFLLFGCGLNSGAPSWDCAHQVIRNKKKLDVTTHEVDEEKHGDWVIAALLKIEKYKEEDLRNFTNYPETTEFVTAMIQKKENETPADFDNWGLRKDSLYQPEIGLKNGYVSLKGKIYHREKGGPFYDFMKEHQNEIVYLDIKAYPNARKDSFTNYGVCNAQRVNCTGRTDDTYRFKSEDGKRYRAKKDGVFKGFFRVGVQELSQSERGKQDGDTITILTQTFPDNAEEKTK